MLTSNLARRSPAEDDARLDTAGRPPCAVRVTRVLQLVDATAEDDPGAMILPMEEADAVMGETVEAYLARVAWRLDLPTVCRINGEYYGRAEWATRAIGLNDNVEFVSRPMGGGSSGSTSGKSILAIVAMIALTAVAGPIGGFVAGAVGLAAGTAAFAITSSLVGALVVGAGSLLLSHFLQPKAGGKTGSTDALYSFGLQGNAARPMQPIPVLNGRVRFAPDFAAPTYSEYAGDQMVDYGLYACTCGDMEVEQIELGDTPIWTKADGYNPSYPGIEIQLVPPGEQVTLYPVNVQTADELQGAELTTEYTPGIIVNAAGTVATELMLDFIWGGGAYVTYKDRTLPANTDILVEARTVNAAGAATGPWTQIFRNVFSQNKQSQIRITQRIPVAPGRYEVRARRMNPSVEDSGIAKIGGTDAVTWTALRARIDGPQSFPRVYTIAVKGIGNKQNSGVSGGQLRVIGTRKLPVWENGAWVVKPTRSIAWAALDWWRNSDYSTGLDLANVDFAAFLAYDALWAQLGHTFDFRFTEVQTLDEVLETILKAGRAFPAPIGDKLTLTREEPRGLARMLFTDNDIVAGSLEIDYALADQAWADGIIGEYLDEASWRVAEVSSAPDGVVLTNPARVQLQGVVQRTQATGSVRFMAAESLYRRTTVSWTGRMEGRLLKRGDLVRLNTSEPETWGSSHEIVATANSGSTLRLDPAPVWTSGSSHWLEIRQRDGRPFGPVRVTRGSTDADLVVNSADAASAATAAAAQYGYAVSLADAVARDATEELPWAAFSPGQPRAYPVLITEGDPDEDGEHIHLKGTLDAPEVYTTNETGVTPLPQIPDLFSSALPVILGLAASISQRQATLVLSAGWLPARSALTYEWGVSLDNGATWANGAPTDRTTVEVVVGASDTMLFRVRGVTPAAQPGGYTITPVIAPPLLIDGDLFADLSIRIEKMSAQLQKDIGAINDAGRGTLALGQQLTVDALAQAQGLIDDARDATRLALSTADDTLRGSIQQLATALDRLAGQQATEATNSYLQRETLKVADGRNFAAIERETRLRVSADEVLASITTSLAVRLDTAEGGIVANASAIQGVSSRVTVAEGTITAQSQQITTLGARIDANDLAISGQATATQQLTTRVTLTEGNIVSLSESLTALRSTVTAQGGQIQANATAIDSVSTRAEQIDGRVTSEAARTTALESTVSAQGGLISGQATALSNLTTRTSTAEGRIESEAARTDALSASVSTQGGQIAGQATAIDSLTARATNTENVINSQADAIRVLQSDVSVQGGAIAGQATAIDSLGTRTTATENGITSVANRATALEATTSTQGGQIAGQATALNSLEARASNVENVVNNQAQALVALQASSSDQDGRLTGQAQAATELTARVTNAEGVINSQATAITSLSTTQNGHTASITTLAASYDGVKVQYGVTGYIDGQSGGFVFTGIKQLDGSVSFNLMISADVFVDGSITARKLSTEQLITTSAQIGSLTVDNINVKDGGISTPVASQSTGQSASVTINVRTANAVSIMIRRTGDLSSRYQTGTNTGALKLYCDDNYIAGLPADFIFDPDFNLRASYVRLGPCTVPFQYAPGVGTHTFRVEDDNGAGIGGVYISVQESK